MSTENTSPLERSIDLSLAIADIERDVEQRLKKMSRSVKLPGFRPGKVPANIVKQQYGAQARHEVLSEMLDAAFVDAVTAQSLRVAGYPRIDAKPVEGTEKLEFTATFEVYPEIALGDLSASQIERPQLDVTEAEIDKTIDILRKQRVRHEAAARPAAKEDRVVIDFRGTKDGVAFDGGSATDYPFVLGQGMMLADFETAVEGMSVGESKTFGMTFPEDYFAKDLAGQPVQFEITVKQVQGPVMPEMDADFAKMLGIPDGDVSKLRGEIEGNLKREVKKRIESRTKDQVMDALLAANPITVPRALVDMEIERLVDNARHDMEARGMKTRDFPIQPAWFAEQAERRVKLGLILAELVQVEQLEAKPEQVRALVEESAQTYERPEEVVDWYYAQPSRLAEVEAVAIENNVVDWVLSKAVVSDKAVAFDELMGQKA